MNQVDESERISKVSEVLLGLAQRRPSYNSLDKDLSTVHRSIVEDKDRGMCRGVQYSKVCSNELCLNVDHANLRLLCPFYPSNACSLESNAIFTGMPRQKLNVSKTINYLQPIVLSH